MPRQGAVFVGRTRAVARQFIIDTIESYPHSFVVGDGWENFCPQRKFVKNGWTIMNYRRLSGQQVRLKRALAIDAPVWDRGELSLRCDWGGSSSCQRQSPRR